MYLTKPTTIRTFCFQLRPSFEAAEVKHKYRYCINTCAGQIYSWIYNYFLNVY